MNRTALSKLIYLDYESINTDDAEKLADFILDNFDPKQETERVTAKEVYRDLVRSGFQIYTKMDRNAINQLAHEAAKAFNNYKPE